MKALIVSLLVLFTTGSAFAAGGYCSGTASPRTANYKVYIEPFTVDGELMRNEKGRARYELKVMHMNDVVYTSNTVVFDKYRVAFSNQDSFYMDYIAQHRWMLTLDPKKLSKDALYGQLLEETPFDCYRVLQQLAAEDQVDR